jgi:hypothetical protein
LRRQPKRFSPRLHRRRRESAPEGSRGREGEERVSHPVHPVQPLVRDERGVIRFKENAIVRFLLDAGLFDLNSLARMNFSSEDWSQFAQLIGYSLSGYGDLSYVSEEEYARATAQSVPKRLKA